MVRSILICLLVVHAALLTWSAGRNSVTIDEYAHVAAGCAYWKYHEWSIYCQSPPLLRLWLAWPAMLAGADVPPATRYRGDPARDRHWNYADNFAALNRSRYHRLIVAARLANVALSCAGLVAVFFVGRRIYGATSATASAAFYALCPNIAAHGSVATTDLGTAVFCLLAIWAWVELARRPTPARAILATLALSAALLCKFTMLLLIPVIAIILLWGWRARHPPLGQLLAGVAIAAAGSLLLVNLAYGYSRSFAPLGQFRFGSSLMQAIQSHLPAALPVPLPRDCVLGFDEQKREADSAPPAFLLGQEYRGTRWSYYPIALACKTPAAVLAALLVVLISFGWRRPKWRDREVPVAAATLLLALGIMFFTNVNIGVRYLLPLFPLVFVLLGRVLAVSGNRRTPIARIAMYGLIGVLAIENLLVAPRYLTFFNALAGGPILGQRILSDSNCDWGQALIDLHDWMNQNDVSRVQLAYFGRIDPGVYGIDYTPANRAGGERYIVVSTYYRAGLAYRMPTTQGMSGWTRLPIAQTLRETEPVAIVGNVLYVYDREDVARAIRND